MIPLDNISAAARNLEGNIHHTPLLTSRTIGDLAGVDLFLKCECFQKTGSFKPRGALNKVLSLRHDDRYVVGLNGLPAMTPYSLQHVID